LRVKLVVVVFLRDVFFVFFLAHPLLAAYFCSRSCVDLLLLPPLFPWPRSTKHKPSQLSHIRLPTNKDKMRLIYNLSGTSHARDAQRVEHRRSKRRSFSAGEKMKIVHGAY